MGKVAVKDPLGNRMKTNYEDRYRFYLPRRMPVIIRIDGKAFHTFTKGFQKPWDSIMIKSMQDTAKFLCENIMGCQMAYTQSDEISLLLVDYKRLESQAWFDNNMQKMCSVAASMATVAFNRAYQSHVRACMDEMAEGMEDLYLSREGIAMFDARVFVLPESEVCNYFIWRQQDAIRNSVSAAGQHYFTQKELQGKKTEEIKTMLETKGIVWGKFQTLHKFGSCVVKEDAPDNMPKVTKDGRMRFGWYVDNQIPLFQRSRDYVERWLKPEEE